MESTYSVPLPAEFVLNLICRMIIFQNAVASNMYTVKWKWNPSFQKSDRCHLRNITFSILSNWLFSWCPKLLEFEKWIPPIFTNVRGVFFFFIFFPNLHYSVTFPARPSNITKLAVYWISKKYCTDWTVFSNE